MSLSAVNLKTNKRAYSAEAYLEPVLDRPNLNVLVGAPVTKVLSENVSGLLIATGAEFSVDGKSYTTGRRTRSFFLRGTCFSQLSVNNDTNAR